MSSEFGLLCEELAAFQAARPLVRPDEARHRAALAKALDNPGAAVAHMAATRHQRTAAATKAQRQLDASLNRTLADLGVMAKAMSVPSPREAFTKAYATFTGMVAAGRFTALDACRLEARFHHVAEGLR